MGLRKLDNTNSWKVNGDPIYIPDAGVVVEFNSIVGEDSGRDESGYMHIFWLRRDIRKISLTYSLMTGAELEYMRKLMQGAEFTFTYVDETGTNSMEAYTSTIKSELYTKFGDVCIYRNVTINVIEK